MDCIHTPASSPQHSNPNPNFFWNLLSSLAFTSSYYPPSCPPPLVALCLLTLPLAHPLLQRPLPPCQAPANIPTFITPSAPPSIPPVWEHVIAVLMKLPPFYCRGTKLEILCHLPLPYISRRLLDVGIGHSPI